MSKFFYNEKILLMLLPFWTPLIPPAGICSIKGHLEKLGYNFKTIDGNINNELWETNDLYFNALKKMIPKEKHGNFFNIGLNILRNHLTAFINQINKDNYRDFIKLLVYNHFYTNLVNENIDILDDILKNFYINLEKFVVDSIEDFKPSIVGISVYSGTLGPSLFAFRLIKEKYPEIVTIMGGSIFADQLPLDSPDFNFFINNTPYIDHIFIGPGESLLKKFLSGELSRVQKIFTLKDIENQMIILNELELADYSDIDLSFYPYISITGSIGCPNRCSFCNVFEYWGPHRQKDISKIIQQMKGLFQISKNQLFIMTDSLLNPYIQKFSESLLSEDISFYWDGYLRASKEVGDFKNTFMWRKAGLYRVRLGIESGSQKVLKLMKKNITVEESKKAVRALAKAGIKTTLYFVIGHPGETEKDFQATLDYVKELKDDIWEVECNPFYFFYQNQTNTEEWENKRRTLYPEFARNMFFSNIYTLDQKPDREEIYKRVFRFVNHCNSLGIPNPYSYQDLFNADQRWCKLHKYAVPNIMEFKSKYINENKSIIFENNNQFSSLKEASFNF